MKSWIQAVSAVLIIAAPICFSAANGQEATAKAELEPKSADAQVPKPRRHQMLLVRVAYTNPQEWMFVIGQRRFKSIDDLKRFIGTMPAGSTLEWNPGGKRIRGELLPLLSSEKDMADFKKFCESKNVKFILIPGRGAEIGMPAHVSEISISQVLDFKKNGVNVFEFSDKTRQLFVAPTSDNTILDQWEISNGKLVHSYNCPKKDSWWSDAVVSPSGKLLVAYAYPTHSNSEVYFIDPQSFEIKHTFEYEHNIRSIKFDRTGSLVWIEQTYPGPDDFVRDENGDRHTEFDVNSFTPLSRDRLWDIPNSKGGPSPGLFLKTSAADAQLLVSNPLNDNYSFTTDEKYVGTSTWDERVCIFRVSDFEKLFDEKLGKHPVRLKYDSVDNRFLIISGRNGNTLLRAVSIPQEPK